LKLHCYHHAVPEVTLLLWWQQHYCLTVTDTPQMHPLHCLHHLLLLLLLLLSQLEPALHPAALHPPAAAASAAADTHQSNPALAGQPVHCCHQHCHPLLLLLLNQPHQLQYRQLPQLLLAVPPACLTEVQAAAAAQQLLLLVVFAQSCCGQVLQLPALPQPAERLLLMPLQVVVSLLLRLCAALLDPC
jgi:hypothetical protein